MNVRYFLHFIFLLLMIKESMQSVPLIVSKGATVILPCSSNQSPNSVFWRFGEYDTVCVIKDGKADFKEQHPAFKGRVEIFSSEISRGNFSIKLSDVKKTDEGNYTCQSPTLFQQEIKLSVKDKPGNGQNKLQVDGVLTFLLGCALLYSFIF